MSTSMNLAERFPKARGFATFLNARRAIDRAIDQQEINGAAYVISQREEDGRWLPIVLVNNHSFNAPALAARNICITNV